MKKLLLLALFTSPFIFSSCGEEESEEKDGDKAEMTKEDQCECLNASLNDRSKACHQWRAQVMKDIKESLGDKADDMDVVQEKLDKMKADCE